MNDIKQIIESANSGTGKTCVTEAVNQILGEDVKVGATVAVVDDPISGYTGAKGKVKSESEANPGFVLVELENGTSVQMQSSLLVPV